MTENSPKKNQKRIRLKYKLILAGLASVLIPFFIAGTIIYYKLSISLLELTKERVLHEAQDVSNLVNDRLTYKINFASSIAADPDIISATKTGDYKDAQLKIESIYQRVGDEQFTIFLTDRNGIARADAFFKEQIGVNLSNRDYFRRAKDGIAGVSDPLMPKGTATPGIPIMVVYAPILDKNEFNGIIAIPFDTEYLLKPFTPHADSHTGYAFLINEKGTVLLHPTREFILNFELLTQPGTENIKKLVQARKDGTASFPFEDSKMIAGISRIKLTGWTAVYTLDVDEFMAPVNEILFSIFIGGIVFVTATVLIVVLFSKRISAPIQKMLEIQRQITRHSTEIILQIGLDKRIIYANPAFERITGIKIEKVIGTEHKFENLNNLSPEAIWAALEAGESWSGRVVHKTNMSNFVTLDIMLIPLRDEHGAIQNYLQIGRDITAEQLYEKRMLQGQKLESIGTLAGGIAHDFNNILSAIFGYAELSLMEEHDNPDTQRYIHEILTASKRARDLVSQILTFSRNTDFELRPLRPKQVLKEVIKLLRASTPAKIEIQSNMDCNSAIMAEPTQLHQIVMNLCMNAAHAIGEKAGTITLDFEDFFVNKEFTRTHPDIHEGKHVRIRISDTGGGIKPEILERIFEPFFTTKSQGKGTGLGLSVVHGIVKKLNGIITVYSEPEKGTVFNIIIPCTATNGSMQDEQEFALKQGSERIVIIDDEQSITTTLQTILANQGYKIDTYTDSLDALKAIEDNPDNIDIIISDYSMPRMSGLEIAEKLNATGINIPLILMSGFIETNIEKNARRAGIYELITKPINCYQITDAIRRIMDDP